MNAGSYCDFCQVQLDLCREFVYQLETEQFSENPMILAYIREHPRYLGEPLRICKQCHASLERNKREQADEWRAQEWESKVARTLVLLSILVALVIAGSLALVGALLRH
jgi:hypothetical protein